MTSASSTLIKVIKLERINYEVGLKLQNIFAQEHAKKTSVPNTLLLLEHTPVYTTGLRTRNYSKEFEEHLKKLGAEFYRSNRGGLITYHGPGQLVAYPILNLKDFKLPMKSYVANLEKCIINLCNHLNLNAYTCEHTGVWINDRKVCAIGVHGSRFITTHGLALNCSLDVLDWFEHIVPCGLEGKGVTSLSREMNENFSVNKAADLLVKTFCETFCCENVAISIDDTNELKTMITEL